MGIYPRNKIFPKDERPVYSHFCFYGSPEFQEMGGSFFRMLENMILKCSTRKPDILEDLGSNFQQLSKYFVWVE